MSELIEPLAPRKRGGLRVLVTIAVVLAVLIGGGTVAALTAPAWAGMSAAEVLNPNPALRPGMSAPLAKDIRLAGVPKDKATEVNPGTPIKVSADNGQVRSVTLVAKDGTEIAGKVSEDQKTWTNTDRLAFNANYTLTSEVIDAAGQTQKKTSSFATVTTPNEADAWMYPMPDTTVGVGQPIEIRFSEPVENKAEVLKAFNVSSTSKQEVRARWVNDKKVRFRPKDYWAANSTITVDVKLFGVEYGNGMVGNFDDTWKVKIGERKIAVADAKSKQMTMYVNGKIVKQYPVTMGGKDWPSSNGVNVIMDQYPKIRFDASTIGLKPGDPQWYDPFDAKNASRLSNNGEFVHEALPAAFPVLGKENISHGCIGMSPEAAKYFIDNMTRGDVVDIKNAAGPPISMEAGMGDWNIPWDKYANTPAE